LVTKGQQIIIQWYISLQCSSVVSTHAGWQNGFANKQGPFVAAPLTSLNTLVARKAGLAEGTTRCGVSEREKGEEREKEREESEEKHG